MHQLNPLTMVATEGDSREREDWPHYYGDDHLWAVLAVTAYLKETGDLAFLDEVIPYYEKNRQEQPIELGTVLDHLQRAIEFTTHDLGHTACRCWVSPTGTTRSTWRRERSRSLSPTSMARRCWR